MTYFAPEESTFGVGFLERLEADAKHMSVTQGPEPSDVMRSIKLNVSKILNTRIGGAQSSPDLGLIDFNDATLDTLDLSVRIKLAIRNCLHNFEPRLKNVEVSSQTDSYSPLSLQFKITAQINSEAIHDRVQFSLLLDQNRKYRVI
ncbi:type VI secretion system baseplate subunit TssE [Vibrio panuliri]|uniref:Lysozyme n=1 Tax=Vibrio panuliri TaxID=1381081 RepID=A0A1Q9HJX6_9VIBR|nr:type VI secretion system baseplate subunit TssE [Vibrio panuliri]KAB1453821.1 type VI secretion system baseplate subunit TssE [Vibrio panuliri]OLQ90629.1 lysozyme [Vibrio panuliri]OLQ91991.1 lysozyme [Vibrio panuliri]